MLQKYLKILIVSLFVILVGIQANKNFVLDEIDFPVVSHAASQTGKPIYYRGEDSPVHVGTYHPTLYINSLAVFIRAFGYSETSVRIFGALCTLATAYLLLLILRLLIKKNDKAEAIFLCLFLLNPYTIANTTLPDIDSTILPATILLFMYAALRYLYQKKKLTTKAILVLGSLFALALWSKLTTPLIIPPFLACLAFIKTKDYKQSLILTLKVSLVGIVAFLVSYFLYCKLLNLSTTYTYTFLVDSFTKGTSSDGPLTGAIKNLENIRHLVFWFTLPLVGLFGVSFIGVLLNKEKGEINNTKKLLVVAASLVTLFYIALISPFGGFFKYPFPVFGILLLAIIFFYDTYFRDTKIRPFYAASSLVAGFIVERIFWGDDMFLQAKPFKGLLILFLLIIASYLVITVKKYRYVSRPVFIFFILFTIGFQASIARIQATATYPTKYHYGQTGLDETVSYLKANTESDEVVWAMKDVGYYVNNRYKESYSYYFNKSLEGDLISMLQDGKVRYYIATTGIGQDRVDAYKNIASILDQHAVLKERFGNFIIYKAKD